MRQVFATSLAENLRLAVDEERVETLSAQLEYDVYQATKTTITYNAGMSRKVTLGRIKESCTVCLITASILAFTLGFEEG